MNQQILQRVVAAIPSTSAIPLGIQLELVGPQRVVPRALVQRCAIAMKDGGWDWEQTLEAGRRLEAAGASFLDKSSGGASYPQKVAAGPGYQIPFPAAIKRAVSIPVIGVGLITDPRQAETILVVEQADAVAPARAFVFAPRWPWRAAADLGATIAAPKQYMRALPQGYPAVFAGR